MQAQLLMVSCGVVNLLQLLVQLSQDLSVHLCVQLSELLCAAVSAAVWSAICAALVCDACITLSGSSASCANICKMSYIAYRHTKSSTDCPNIPRRDSHCAVLQLKLALMPSPRLLGLWVFMMHQPTFGGSSSSSSCYIVLL